MANNKKKVKLLSLSPRCNVDSPRKYEMRVHRGSQIIQNIYFAQINSCWNESAEDICKILKCTFLRGHIMGRLLLLRRCWDSQCSPFRCVNLQINNIKHEISWGSLCFLSLLLLLILNDGWILPEKYNFSFMMQFPFVFFGNNSSRDARMYRQPPQALLILSL